MYIYACRLYYVNITYIVYYILLWSFEQVYWYTWKHFGSQYQPSHDKPITKQYEAVILNAMTDVEGLDRAYARDNGSCIRNTTMVVSGAKDFPQVHWDDLKIPT